MSSLCMSLSPCGRKQVAKNLVRNLIASLYNYKTFLESSQVLNGMKDPTGSNKFYVVLHVLEIWYIVHQRKP